MARRTGRLIANLTDLLAYEAELDQETCGISLADDDETRLAAQGAHDPTPTPYFVLEELLAHVPFDENTHLLDVGCGTGRVLAYFLRAGFAGNATGIELDPQLAAFASSWAKGHSRIRVLCGSVLDADLSPYNAFYLFNPFDQGILQQFIEALELQVTKPCTVVHMSDNGDTWRYVGRAGWTELASGSFSTYRNQRGYQIRVYDHPQHYTVWRFEP